MWNFWTGLAVGGVAGILVGVTIGVLVMAGLVAASRKPPAGKAGPRLE